MTSHNKTPAEMVAVLGSIDPDANGAGTLLSDYGDASKFGAIMAIVQAGTMGSSGTINADILQATDSSGTGAKVVTGSAITELTEAGTDSDKQAVICLSTDKLDSENGFTYVALRMIVATATSDSSGILLGTAPRFAPASNDNVASVDEVVTV